jgi:hypothetical protein
VFGEIAHTMAGTLDPSLASLVDSVARAEPVSPVLANAAALAKSLRGIGSKHQAAPPPMQSASASPGYDPFAAPSRGMYMPRQPRDPMSGRVLVRFLGIGIGILLAAVRLSGACGSHHSYDYPSYQPPYHYDPATGRDGLDDFVHGLATGACHGEPVVPVTTVAVPGSGDVDRLSAYCGSTSMRVLVQRGGSIYSLVRSSNPGAAWIPEELPVATSVAALSDPAPAADGGAFVAFASSQGERIGVTRVERDAAVHYVDLPQGIRAGELFALGATESNMFVATRVSMPHDRSAIAVLRIPSSFDANEDDDGTGSGSEPSAAHHANAAPMFLFEIGTGYPKSVRPGTTSAVLLASQITGLTSARLTAFTIDLNALDSASRGASHAPAGSLATPPSGAVHPSETLALAAPVVLAGSVGVDDSGDTTFVFAGSTIVPAGGQNCDHALTDGTCLSYREVRTAVFPASGTPTLGNPLVAHGVPLAMWRRESSYELVLQGDAMAGDAGSAPLHRALRISLNAARSETRRGGFVMPRSVPQMDGFAYVTCADQTPWMVFAGGPSFAVRAAAIPAACTSVRPHAEESTNDTSDSTSDDDGGTQ